MALDELESTLARIREWASYHNISIKEGILELGEAFPTVTVVGFAPEDVQVFLDLAGMLGSRVLVLDGATVEENELQLAADLAREVTDPEERAHSLRAVKDGRKRLGKLYQLHAVAIGPEVQRAVAFRAAADWSGELFGLTNKLIRDSID